MITTLLLMSFGDSGEILGHKGITIIKIPIVIMQIVMPDFIHRVDYNFWYPLLFDFLDPPGVIVVDG